MVEARFNPAGPQVVKTAELLEAILLNLSTRDLLLAQRTSKSFKAMIDGTTKLQQEHSFFPDPPNGIPRVNDLFFRASLFAKHEPYLHKNGITFERQIGRSHLTFKSAGLVLEENGELSALMYFEQGRECVEGKVGESKHGRKLGDHRPRQLQKCYTCKCTAPLTGGSWKRMFVSQPAMEEWWDPADVKYGPGKRLGEELASWAWLCDRPQI